jgi:hypothetical protein
VLSPSSFVGFDQHYRSDAFAFGREIDVVPGAGGPELFLGPHPWFVGGERSLFTAYPATMMWLSKVSKNSSRPGLIGFIARLP